MTANPETCLQPLANLLATLTAEGIVPASLHTDWPHTTPEQPHTTVHLRYRTDLERLATTLGLRVESATKGGYRHGDQQHYWTKGDGPMLLQAVSYPHHHDWNGPA